MKTPYVKTAAVFLFSSFMLSGCWDLKNPQDINYFTAVGFDYVDGQYVVYAQMIDFLTVAKTEVGSRPEQPIPVWVGHAEGQTAASAFNNLYDTSQFRVFYGHVNAIIYHDRVLKRNIMPLLDLENRFYEMRYTPWVFGTSEPINELMNIMSFFNMPPTNNIMHQPQEMLMQKSVIRPVTIREFICELREPARTVTLPTLGIDVHNWKQGYGDLDLQPRPFLKIDGIYLFHDGKYRGKLEKNEVLGLRWTDEETPRSPLLIKSNDKNIALLALENPKVTITPVIKDDRVIYKFHVSLKGNVMELFERWEEQDLERLAAEKIQSEIRDAYEDGLALKADLLQLEHTLYRKNVHEWKKLREREKLELTNESLDIEVEVNLTTSGKLKMMEYNRPKHE